MIAKMLATLNNAAQRLEAREKWCGVKIKRRAIIP